MQGIKEYWERELAGTSDSISERVQWVLNFETHIEDL
jgi:hypothetical protein